MLTVLCCAVLCCAVLCSPDWMLGTPDAPGNCQKSCGMCDDYSGGGGGAQLECADYNENCEYWASVGECDNRCVAQCAHRPGSLHGLAGM